MSYTKREDIPVRTGEQAVELDTGDLVAACCVRNRSGTSLALHARARAVDVDGATIVDSRGDTVDSEHIHTATAESLAEHGADALARDCLLLVLGEPTEVLAPSPAVVTSASIRSAIEATRNEGEVAPGELL